MPINTAQALGVGAGGSLVGVPLLIWFIKRMTFKGAFEDTSKAATDAQCSVIEMLQAEVTRMSKFNGELAEALRGMQAENLKMQGENIKFRLEIAALHETITELTDRINIISNKDEGNRVDFSSRRRVDNGHFKKSNNIGEQA